MLPKGANNDRILMFLFWKKNICQSTELKQGDAKKNCSFEFFSLL